MQNNADQIRLLPAPKSLCRKDGFLDVRALGEAAVPENAAGSLLDAFCATLRIQPRRRPAPDGRLALGTTAGAAVLPGTMPVPAACRPEAYALRIERDGVVIAAAASAGFAHAFRTLLQLAEICGGRLPCAEIADYPDIALRGYHLDCKGGLPSLEGLYDFTNRLIRWKINALLLEYEDRFPFRFAPEITLPGSPKLEEWDAFLRHCRAAGMTVIPLVQTHGHLNYVLKHDRFAALREGEEVSEICPSNPDAVQTVKTMLDEVLALHGPDQYFHIGADETWSLASCPRCRERLQRGETKLDVFCAQVEEMHRHLQARGKQTMMWCDMFWRSDTPEQVARLPKDIILCEWIYTLPTSRGSPRMAWNGRLRYTRKYCADHPEMPVLAEHYLENAGPKAVEFAREYLQPDSATGIGKLSAHAEYFMRQGYRVLGVGAARSGQCDWNFGQPNIIDRINNIANWADYAAGAGLQGVVISSWSRSSGSRPPYSPWLSALDAMAATAQYLWTPATRFEDFAAIAAGRLFGAPAAAAEVAKIYRYMGVHPHYARNCLSVLEPQIRRGREHFAMLQLWCEFDLFRAEMADQALGLEKSLSNLHYDRLPRRGERVSLDACLARIPGLLEQCARWREKLAAALAPYYRPEELPEYIDSRLFNLEFRLHNIQRYLQSAAVQP